MRGFAHWFSGSVALGGSALAFLGGSPQEHPHAKLDFNRDIRPILSEHCWPCHGADSSKGAGLRLDSFTEATKLRGTDQPIKPGDSAHSMIWQRISAKDEADRMPPKNPLVKPLNATEQETIKRWIEEGAAFQSHWAFEPPQMPKIPSVPGATNPIDSFVQSRLRKEGLTQEPQADKATLIRRVALTLTGLPPTPTEVAEYLKDGNYEKMVDRFLASPKYGENQARFWLDAIRYGDTHGLHLDNERGIWPYRDWVVSQYNKDLPYDKFTLWQVAGDLLPKPTLEQKLATGYVRMNPTTAEGGAIEQEFLVKNTFDRVDTTSTVFLGVTMGCSKCHDHKYDPFSMKDYYSMFAFFNSTSDSPLDGNAKDHPPTIKVPTPLQEQRLTEMTARMATLVKQVNLGVAQDWAKAVKVSVPTVGEWQISQPFVAKSFEAAFASEDKPTWKPVKVRNGVSLEMPIGKDNASVYLQTTFTADRDMDFVIRVSSDDGIKVWHDGKVVHSNQVLRALLQSTDVVKLHLHAGENKMQFKVVNASGGDGFYIAYGSPAEQRLLDLSVLVKKGTLSPADEKLVREGYLEVGPKTGAGEEYRSLIVGKARVEAAIPTSLVAEELKMGRPAFTLRRGQYDLQDKPVSRAIPAVFGNLPSNAPKNRLGLAEWLVDPKNPLVARVFVNRVWQQHFGVGLVKSAEDFGSRGEFPSHPELLDYLSCRFIQDGWSLKKLHRLILTSATFRQSAATSQAKHEKDPENRLLAHGPRFRLDAEVIRDQALYVAGLLDPVIGGPGVKPYQPAGLWEAVGYTASNTARFSQDHGEALYRRSLYTFWKRTSPPPSMLIFDAPMRESCVVARTRTNTPLQALVTMNDPQFVEAARGFAQRVCLTNGTDMDKQKVAFKLILSREPTLKESQFVEKLLNNQLANFKVNPKAAEKLIAVGESPRDRHVPAIEHAAWTVVCNALLNLDEALTQH